jgi:hypothetical protein
MIVKKGFKKSASNEKNGYLDECKKYNIIDTLFDLFEILYDKKIASCECVNSVNSLPAPPADPLTTPSHSCSSQSASSNPLMFHHGVIYPNKIISFNSLVCLNGCQYKILKNITFILCYLLKNVRPPLSYLRLLLFTKMNVLIKPPTTELLWITEEEEGQLDEDNNEEDDAGEEQDDSDDDDDEEEEEKEDNSDFEEDEEKDNEYLKKSINLAWSHIIDVDIILENFLGFLSGVASVA